MSERYPGGFISKNAPTVSTSGAQGVWTLEQQAAYQKAGQWPFGGPFNYIEDVFSTYLYTGNGSTQTITNGLDISGKGGLVWLKTRSVSQYHYLFDTSRGPLYALSTNATDQSYSIGNTVTAFNSNGFNLGLNSATNGSGDTFVSWTFRKQPKFFDVVTYTGNGVAGRQISHNLGSTPGFIAVKKTSNTGDWLCYHQARPAKYFYLNTTAAEGDDSSGVVWGNGTTAVAPTSTNFTVNALTAFPSADINKSGETYVAYLFAHNAGGFGTAGTDNVISCGSFTTDGSGNASVNLGYEPQWVMWKAVSGSYPTGNWWIADNMRGFSQTGMNTLYANTSGAENAFTTKYVCPTATGFELVNSFENPTTTYIYIAIRRGPMKTPTTGASVFEPAFATANSPEYKSSTVTSGFDTAINIYRPGYSDANISFPYTATRLQGARKILQTARTNAEYTYSTAANFAYNTGWFDSTFGNDSNRESYMFKRAPGFHDVVCYAGTGASRTINHNLGVVPELIIVKDRTNATYDWFVYSSGLTSADYILRLDLTLAQASAPSVWNSTIPTSTVFSVGTAAGVNASGDNYVALLFASCPGVSKVGSYTGTGSNQTINCGLASGVRWVLIKRIDTTGDWYVYDTTRGMTSGNDPYILLNSVAAEVTGTNYVETIATGFRLIGSNAGTNASGGSYIYLAIA